MFPCSLIHTTWVRTRALSQDPMWAFRPQVRSGHHAPRTARIERGAELRGLTEGCKLRAYVDNGRHQQTSVKCSTTSNIEVPERPKDGNFSSHRFSEFSHWLVPGKFLMNVTLYPEQYAAYGDDCCPGRSDAQGSQFYMQICGLAHTCRVRTMSALMTIPLR